MTCLNMNDAVSVREFCRNFPEEKHGDMSWLPTWRMPLPAQNKRNEKKEGTRSQYTEINETKHKEGNGCKSKLPKPLSTLYHSIWLGIQSLHHEADPQ